MTRVLCWTPYGLWHYHGAVEATVLHALRTRGAEIEVVLCDQLFPICDLFRPRNTERSCDTCSTCEQFNTEMWRRLQIPPQWLGRWMPSGVREAASAFVDAATPEELTDATWKGRPVGAWAASTVLYQNRASFFHLDDPEHVDPLRKGVWATIVALEAIGPMLDELRPDAVLMLNGRFFSHRVLHELGRERGVRFLFHERGFTHDSLYLTLDRPLMDRSLYDELEARWRAVPLDDDELRWLDRHLGHRRHGEDMSFVYSPPAGDTDALRRQLRLDHRPVVVAYTSSPDEMAAYPAWREGAWPTGFGWLQAMVDFARRHPELIVVIRAHPNLIRGGGNAEALAELRDLAHGGLAHNVRVVLPQDDVSSYTLAELASAAVVYYSTMGLELACRGLPVLRLAVGPYGADAGMPIVRDPEALEPMLLDALARGPSRDSARAALRYAYRYLRHLSMPFPLVQIGNHASGHLQWSELSHVTPGRDPTLDAMCEALLHGTDPLPRPTDAQRALSTADEDAYLARAVRPRLTVPPDAQPRASLAKVAEGEAAFARGELEQACRLFLQAIELNPMEPTAWNDLGVALFQSGDPSGALEAFEQGLDRAPGHQELLVNLAKVRVSVR